VALVGAAAAGAAFWLWPRARPVEPVVAQVEEEVFEAPQAHATVVALGDDRVGVAASAKIRVDRHDPKQLRVQLERGAVAAKVKHREPGQSFVVTAGRYQVTVVGTQFRVERRGEGLRVDVLEGHVKVSAGTQSYDVLGAQSLELDEAGARSGAFEGADFEELSQHPAVAPPAPAPDASTPEPEPEPSHPAQATIPAATVQQWRRGALEGRCAELLPTLRTKTQEYPRQPDVWAVLADCQRLTGADRDAAKTYRHVVTIAAPEEGDRARLLLASLLLDRLGDPAGAVDVLRTYLKHKQVPDLEATARLKLAKAYLAQGRDALAKAELERLVKAMPETPSAMEALQLLKQHP